MKQILFLLCFAALACGLYSCAKKIDPAPPHNIPNTGDTTKTPTGTIPPKIMGISSSAITLIKSASGNYTIPSFSGSNIYAGGFIMADGGTIKVKLRNPGTITVSMVDKTPYISFSTAKIQDPGFPSKIDTTGAVIEFYGDDLLPKYGTNRILMVYCVNAADYSGKIAVTSQQDISLLTPDFIKNTFGTEQLPRLMNITNLLIAPDN